MRCSFARARLRTIAALASGKSGCRGCVTGRACERERHGDSGAAEAVSVARPATTAAAETATAHHRDHVMNMTIRAVRHEHRSPTRARARR